MSSGPCRDPVSGRFQPSKLDGAPEAVKVEYLHDMRSLQVDFVVQGEGRGHMTQALGLASYLRAAGHEVRRVLLGRSPYRSVPRYFLDGIGAPVETFDGPTQVPDASGEGVSMVATAVDAVRRSPRFVRAVQMIDDRTRGADVVVNFLDLLGALALRRKEQPVPAMAVAHNYLFLHPELAGAPGPSAMRRAVLSYFRATTLGSGRTLALSFGPMDSGDRAGLEVTPPLIRPGLSDLRVEDDGSLLAYALNAGYGRRLVAWQKRHPEVTVHCFVDGGMEALGLDGLDTRPDRSGSAPPVIDGRGEGSFNGHALNDISFLEHLARCRAFVGSAGFESLCEAHFLGKPVLAVPTDGQFEQLLNAWDAERCGIARHGSYDDLDEFWSAATAASVDEVQAFRAWVDRGPEIFVDAVERTARSVPSHNHVGDRV